MSYREGIVTAITTLKDRNGSSMIAIKKHMQENLPKDKKWINGTFLNALKNGVAAGDFVKVKNSYKLSAEFKKAAAKKASGDKKKAAPAKKKAPAKKSATKKTAAKKSTTKSKASSAKKTTASSTKKKTTAKKAAPKKTPAKKAAPKKTTAKKAAPKKTTAKKSTKKSTKVRNRNQMPAVLITAGNTMVSHNASNSFSSVEVNDQYHSRSDSVTSITLLGSTRKTNRSF